MSRTTPATCPGRTGGATCAHLLLPVPPATRPAPSVAPAPLVAQAVSAASPPLPVRSGGPGLPSPLVPATHCPTHDHPSRQARFGQRQPSRSPTTATRRTRCAQRGQSRGTGAFRDPARCGQHGCSGRGHRTPVCPDIRITPVAWTLDTVDIGRPPDPLDGRLSAWRQRMRTERRTAWPVSGHPERPPRRRPPAGGATSLGSQRPRHSATDDGFAVTTPAAAVTGQLRSTARHEAAPRRTAVLRRSGLSVERRGGGHPVHSDEWPRLTLAQSVCQKGSLEESQRCPV
jgi:hypothetical protein